MKRGVMLEEAHIVVIHLELDITKMTLFSLEIEI